MHRLLILLLALVALPASAGLRGTYAIEHDRPRLVRIADNGDIDAELGPGLRLIVKAGEAFIVEDRLTGPLVMRVEDLEAMLSERSARARPNARPDASFNLVRRGNAEVNGRSGRAYFVPDEQGRAFGEDLVVISDDPALAELRGPMRRLFAARTLLSQLEWDMPPILLTEGDAMVRLLDDGTPLRFGAWSLRAIEQVAIDPAGFALPAEPESREAMRARRAAEAAEEERSRGSDDHMISRAVFAGGRLWLLTDTGRLSSLAEGEMTRTPYDLGEEVLDLCAVDDAPFLLTGHGEEGDAWTIRRRQAGQWRTVRSVARTGDAFVAMSCGPGGQILLTSRRLIDLGQADAAAVRLSEELRPGLVNAVVHITPDAAFVGFNVGEWGGGLERVDRRTGRIDRVEHVAAAGICEGPLNTGCDPVHAIVTVPWRPECVAAAIGLIHMIAHGRIVTVCPDGIEQLFAAPDAVDPADPEEVAEAARGGLGSVAFFGVAARGDGLIAVGHDGIYRIDSAGAAVRQAWPRFTLIDGVLISFALPDMVLVLTGINGRAAMSGAAPILVIR